MKKILLLVISLIIISGVYAVQPTQQYNKIYLQPFYRAQMAVNTNYPYNLTINPPDGISKVLSAIITIDAWTSSSDIFNLTIGGVPCNNPTYMVPIAAGFGRSTEIFDCSNVITVAGNYSINLRHNQTTANTNASSVTAWIDLTYLNNPKGDILLSGTEYTPGDPATLFVQLKDNQGLPVSSANCYLDIFNPTGSHTVYINNTPMTPHINANDGLYFYDLTAPSTLGVYMVSAQCSYAYNWVWIYPAGEQVFAPTRTAVTGTWTGALQGLNNPDDAVYDSCQTSTNCVANYTFNLSQYGVLNNITSLNLYFMGEATKATTLTFNYWNGTSFVAMANNLALVATGSTSAPSGVDQQQSNIAPVTAVRNGTVTVQVSDLLSTTHALYINWLAFGVITNTGSIIQNVKGDGEMHITNIPNATVTLVNNQTPAYVWNYSNRTLTSFPTINASVDTVLIAQNVWNYSVRNLTYYQNFSIPQQDMTNYSKISNLTALDVWTFIMRNLTFYPSPIINTTTVNVLNTTLNITVNNTFVTVQNVTYNIVLNTTSVTVQNTTLNITVNNTLVIVQNTTTNITLNTTSVTVQNNTLNITINNTLVTVQNVSVNVNNVSVIAQNVTVQNVTVNVNNYTINNTVNNYTINNTVINYTVALTNYTINNTVNNYTISNTVFNYTINNTVNNYTINNTVNNYTINNTVINYTINNTINNYTINITVNDTSINITLNNTYVAVQNVTVNTTSVTINNVTVNVDNVSINNTDIAANVWNYSVRNLTYYQNFTVPQIDMTNYSLIAANVWNYNQTISSILIEQFGLEVWNYSARYVHGILV